MRREDFLRWVDTAETWPEYVARMNRREERMRIAGLIAGMVLAFLTAGLGVAWFLGAP